MVVVVVGAAVVDVVVVVAGTLNVSIPADILIWLGFGAVALSFSGSG